MFPLPELPQPAHLGQDSMLSRKFGTEVANYFGSSALNRVSFLRNDYAFLRQAFDHSTSQFMLFKDLSPLVKSSSEIAHVKRNDVKPIFPENPYERTEEQTIQLFNSSISIPQLVFLGLDERNTDGLRYKDYLGSPNFAVDVTPQASYEQAAEGVIAATERLGFRFLEGMRVTDFPAESAANYAMGRAFLDWNARNPYCASCGQPTLSINAGAKRTCPPTDFASTNGTTASTKSVGQQLPVQRPPCSTRTSRSNLAFPRTDATIIVAVLSHDSKRLLLGRQKRWPPDRYSTLAGFIEPAESAEDAGRREVWEETGVVLSRVVIHSTQPWPYPANLMIGAIAQVANEEDEKIRLDNDPELEAARWFSFDEVREALRNGSGFLGDGAQSKEGGRLRLPPRTAIANQLISAVVDGDFLSGVPLSKI